MTESAMTPAPPNPPRRRAPATFDRRANHFLGTARLVREQRVDRSLMRWLVHWNPWHVIVLFAAAVLAVGLALDALPAIAAGGAGLAYAAVGIIQQWGRQ